MFAQEPETPPFASVVQTNTLGKKSSDQILPRMTLSTFFLEMQKTNSLVIPDWYMHFFSPAQVLKILMAVAKMVPRFWQTSLSFTGILLSRR